MGQGIPAQETLAGSEAGKTLTAGEALAAEVPEASVVETQEALVAALEDVKKS